MIQSWPPKEAHEHLDYGVDFRPRLVGGETVVTKDAVVEYGTIEITSSTQADGLLMIWIQGGVRNELARVLSTITTNVGRTLTETVILPIK